MWQLGQMRFYPPDKDGASSFEIQEKRFSGLSGSSMRADFVPMT